MKYCRILGFVIAIALFGTILVSCKSHKQTEEGVNSMNSDSKEKYDLTANIPTESNINSVNNTATNSKNPFGSESDTSPKPSQPEIAVSSGNSNITSSTVPTSNESSQFFDNQGQHVTSFSMMNELELSVGEKRIFVASVVPKGAIERNDVETTVSKENVVKIITPYQNNSIYIEAISVGTCKLTLKSSNGVTGVCNITVK